MLKKIVLCLLIITESILSFVTASEAQWSAFGTLGLTLADSNQLGYRNNINTDSGVYAGDIDFKTNSMLGGQVDVAISKKLDFLGQVVLKDMIDAKASDYITMAFVRYSPSAKWSIRLGRIIPDIFKITEYRNINVAYTWTNVPTEVYGLIPFNQIDGGDITYKARLNSGTFKTKFFIGSSKSVIPANTFNEHFKLSPMFGLSLAYDQFEWNLQVRYTNAKFDNSGISTRLITEQINLIPDTLWPNKSNFTESINLKGTHAEYFSISGQREWERWLLGFEIGMVDAENIATETINNGYFSAAYRHQAYTYYAVYSQSAADNYVFNEPINTSYFPELITSIESMMNFYSSNQQTISIGWRWDINTNLTSKLQVNRTAVDDQGDTLWLNINSDNSGRTVSSMMYTLSFAL